MIFFLSVLLLVPTGARACWDEDWDDYEDTGSWDDDWNDLFDDLDEWIGDDNYYDDSDFDLSDNDDDYTGGPFIYDDNGGSGGFGIGVVGHRPDEDAVGNDWWINQYPDNDDYEEDEDIQGWGDDEGDDSTAGRKPGHSTIGAVGKEFKDYKIQKGDKVIIKDYADRVWKKQAGVNDCTITAMEYAAQILRDNNLNYRMTYEDDFSHYIEKRDISEYGLNQYELEALMNIEFDYEKITLIPDINEALSDGCPVIAIIDGNMIDYLEIPIEHMITIIGRTDSGGMYICIDPSDGGYKTVSSFSLLGDSYRINGMKKY